MSGSRNPWSDGLLTVAVLLIPLAVLGIFGVLIAMAVGVDLTGGPEVGPQTAGIILLSVTTILLFVAVMSYRWDTRRTAHKDRDEADR